MGSYVYRATTEVVQCSDGSLANVAEFAYKPFGWWSNGEKLNRKMHFKSGAQASDNMAARGNVSDRIAVGRQVYENRNRVGSFFDDSLGGPGLERAKSGYPLAPVTAPEFPPEKLYRDTFKRGEVTTAEVGSVRERDGISFSIMAMLTKRGNEFVMTCSGLKRGEAMHSISATSSADRLAAHWVGFLENCRANFAEE